MTKITKINYIKTSEHLKVFSLQLSSQACSDYNIIYFSDSDINENDGYGNISCEDLGQINNIYKSDKLFYKSAQKSSSDDSTYGYNNIFAHELSSQISDVVQSNGVFYSFTDKDVYGSYILNEDIYSYISSDTGHITPNDVHISTLTFEKTDLTIKSNIEGIKYNKLLEIPGFYKNDYDSGNLIANTYKLKNHYSGIYNMEHDQNNLSNTRNYIGIGSFNDKVYLKYTDNNDNYEKIEVIQRLNRKLDSQKHKTTLFSLNINANMQLLYDNNNMLAVIKKQVQNIVRKYVEKLKPVNTQLFKIDIK